jgi:hypothetical protein
VARSPYYALHEVTAVSIIVALRFLIVSITAVLTNSPALGHQDLGWVSERWLADHRAGESRPSG